MNKRTRESMILESLTLNENTRESNLDIMTKVLSDNKINYSLKGKRYPDIVVSRKDLDKATKLCNKAVPELLSMSPISSDFIAIVSKM